MSKQIQIRSVEDLINFINEVDIPFNEYIKVVNAYFDAPFYWLGERSKENLISKIKELPTDTTAILPIFPDIE